MKAWIAIAAMSLSALSVAATPGLPPSWTRATEPFEIFDDVYWVGTEGLAAYLFVTPEGHILLDVGMPQSADTVEASIEQLGFAVTDVKYLLNSHAHLDHSGGLARLKADSGAHLVASAGDRDALENGVYPGWEDRTNLNFPPVQVDRVIADGETVTLGGLTLTAHVTPGHSAGCTSWGFTARDGGQQYRALVFCSASVALNRLAPDPQYPGIVGDYRATFRRMREMEVDAFLAPHPEQFGLADKLSRAGDGKPNPFVDPAEKGRRMAAFEQAFEAALAEQRSAQVTEVERDFARTMAERDHAAFATFLAEDAVFFDGERPIRGRDAVAAAWKPFFDGAQAPFSWEPETVTVLASGDLALSSGPVYDPAGEVTARFQSVWRLVAPGQWRIVFDKGSPACMAAKS